MSEKPTLLEDLEVAARYAEEDAANALSARLRDHARRLREEMERFRSASTNLQFNLRERLNFLDDLKDLERLNAGPLETP